MYHSWYAEKCKLQGDHTASKCWGSRSASRDRLPWVWKLKPIVSAPALAARVQTDIDMRGEKIILTGKADYSLWYELYAVATDGQAFKFMRLSTCPYTQEKTMVGTE